MPLGIPDITKILLPPEGSDQKWKLNVQEHRAKRAGLHFDIRLNPPNSTSAHSWASRYPLPLPGNKLRVFEQPTHSSDYMGWEGTIEDEPDPLKPRVYGAGDVRSILLEDAHVIESNPDKILFNLYKGNDVERYSLIRSSGKTWVLSNYTRTTADKLVPDYKPKYSKHDLKDLHLTSEQEVLAPKVDGAHNTVIIRPNKRIDVYSYRKRKNKSTRIDHTYKTDLYKIRAPRELGTTVVRTELYIPGNDDSAEVTGILNSNTWKARESIKALKEEGKHIEPMIFDVVTYKGKNVENDDYTTKLRILKEINQYIPGLVLPELATTKQEKLKLLDAIKSKKHPKTKEGVVVYNLRKAKPGKAKIKDDFDVLITGVFEAKPGTKYAGKAIGGFTGIPEGSTTPIRVGSGLSDELRQAAFRDPNLFIGNWMKVEGQGKYAKTGQLRMAIFKGFRTDKYRNV